MSSPCLLFCLKGPREGLLRTKEKQKERCREETGKCFDSRTRCARCPLGCASADKKMRKRFPSQSISRAKPAGGGGVKTRQPKSMYIPKRTTRISQKKGGVKGQKIWAFGVVEASPTRFVPSSSQRLDPARREVPEVRGLGRARGHTVTRSVSIRLGGVAGPYQLVHAFGKSPEKRRKKPLERLQATKC